MKYIWSTFGHTTRLEELERDLGENNVAHAYLFIGPEDIGKFTIARKLAGILQCEKDFCHDCASCVQIEKGQHFDTIELANNGESIKIEEVRKIIDRLQMSRQSNYKIVLIDGLQRMTPEAANSFLKMLEEPPERTMFIMTAPSINLLLPTIVSRVRILNFTGSRMGEVKDQISEMFPELSNEVKDQISGFSYGKMGRAVRLARNPEMLADLLVTYHHVERFLDNTVVAEKFAYVNEIAEEDGKVESFLQMLTLATRSRLHGDVTTRDKHSKNLLKIADAGILLKKNVNMKLVLENLMLAL